MAGENEEGRVVHRTLVLPHYIVQLAPGAAVLSELRGDSWVVRFVYDPVNYRNVALTEALRHSHDPWWASVAGSHFDSEPTHTPRGDVTPPILAAFGDPGERRSEVEKAFYERVCVEWCSIVRRRLRLVSEEEVARAQAHAPDIEEMALEHADVWQATGETMDRDLLNMFETAQGRWGRVSSAHERASLEQSLDWDEIDDALDEREYFRAKIAEWRIAPDEPPTRFGGIFDP